MTKISRLHTIVLMVIVAILIALLLPQVAFALGYQEEPPPPLTVPQALSSVLLIVMSYFVNMGLKYVLAHFGIDFTGHGPAVTQALFTTLLVFLNGGLAQIPLAFHGVAREILLLLAIALGGFGLKQLEVADRAAKLGMSSAFELMQRRRAEARVKRNFTQ